MKPNTEDIEKGKEHWEKGTTKTIGKVKRVVQKMYGDNDTEAAVYHTTHLIDL